MSRRRPFDGFGSRLILLISAEPTDQDRLRVAAEFRDIEHELRSSLWRGDFRVRQIGAARASDVSRAILEEEPFIVHFAGHGDEGLLCLEDDDGQTRAVDAESFAKIFSVLEPPACVVLNACYSDSHAEALLKYVPAVVSMSAEVDDDAARAFAVSFFAAIGADVPVADAFEWGRVQLALRGLETQLPRLRLSASVPQSDGKRPSALRVDSLVADSALCPYDTFVFDPERPRWPTIGGNTITYNPDGTVEEYGQIFPSSKEAKEYEKALARAHNHRSFRATAVHRVALERVGRKAKYNVPVLYVAVSNRSSEQLILTELQAHVISATPLASMGESEVLDALVSYELPVSPAPGVYSVHTVPALKVAENDATAFRVVLQPRVARIGGYHWLMRLRLITSDRGTADSDYFTLIM